MSFTFEHAVPSLSSDSSCTGYRVLIEAIQVKKKNNKSKVEDYVELDSFNEETSWG